MILPLFIASAYGVCVNTTLVKHLSSKEVSNTALPFCGEHNSRTCCDTSSALAIYKKFYRIFNDPPIFDGYSGYSYNCLQYMQKAFCHECDGDV
jgi:hypothetical protein